MSGELFKRLRIWYTHGEGCRFLESVMRSERSLKGCIHSGGGSDVANDNRLGIEQEGEGAPPSFEGFGGEYSGKLELPSL